MRIALFLDRYLPTPLSSARMFHDLAQALVDDGHDVTVVTGDDSLSQPMTMAFEGAIRVIRVRAAAVRNPSRALRAMHEVRFPGIVWKRTAAFFRKSPPDLVICYAPPIFWGRLVQRLIALHGGRFYLVLRDLFPQWALDAKLLTSHGLPYRYFKRREMQLYRTAHVIGVQSPANLTYFSTPAAGGPYRLEVLYNWTTGTEAAPTTGHARKALGLEGKVVFFYGGNLGVAQDIDNLLRLAVRCTTDPAIHFLIVGDGSEFERIEAEIARQRLPNVRLLPAVTHERYHEILADCDVGLITLRADLKTHNFPGKMLSYMERGKPLLASINPGNDLQTLVHDYEAGFVCHNGDDAELAAHAFNLARDAGLRGRLGANARRLQREKFHVTSAARQILSHFS